MSVSRDFIDSYSRSPENVATLWSQGRPRAQENEPDAGTITLVFRIQAGQDLFKALISFAQTGCFFLTLGEESLQRVVQTDGFVDFRAGSGPIGPQPDQFFHVRIGRHDRAGAGDSRQVG